MSRDTPKTPDHQCSKRTRPCLLWSRKASTKLMNIPILTLLISTTWSQSANCAVAEHDSTKQKEKTQAADATSEIFKNRLSAEICETESELPDSEIISTIEGSPSSPSNFNFQNWHFVVISNEEIKNKIADQSVNGEKPTV